MRRRGGVALLLVAALALLATAGACGGDAEGQRPPGQSTAGQTAASSQARAVTLAPESAMPQFPAGTSADTVIAYRYAVANPDVLRVMPCYCGCGSVGHMSNLDCYVSEYRADGTPVFDGHAVFWQICIDITRDVMDQVAEGRSLNEIRDYIDATYSRFGASTDTPPP